MRVSTKVVIAMESGEVLERESYLHLGPVELCRGEDKKTASLADTGREKQEAMNAQLMAEREQGRNLLIPEYKKLLGGAGSGPEMEAAAASFGSAQDQLARRAGRTGNSAGVIEGQDLLARGKAQEQSDIIRKNQMAALQGMGSLYGMDTNLLARALGLPPEYLQIRGRAMEPKGPQGFDLLKQGIASAGQVASGWLSGRGQGG